MTAKRFAVLYKLEMSLSEKEELVSMKPQPIFKRIKGESETKLLGESYTITIETQKTINEKIG